MSADITLFAMSRKGLAVLEVLGKMARGRVHVVIGARDPHVQDDCYDEIRRQCGRFDMAFADRADVTAFETEYALAVSWRWLIPVDRGHLIVFHDSLLPKYRGFAPLVSALIAGEKEVGVSVLHGTETYDTGNVIAQARTPLDYPIKIREAISRVCACYRDLTVWLMQSLACDGLPPGTPQDEGAATYSLWRDEDDYRVDWSLSAARIKRFVDAVGPPYLSASTRVNGVAARLLDTDVRPDVSIAGRMPGKVIFVEKGKPVVVCGKGLLLVNELVDEDTRQSLLPLTSFRTRFT